MDCVESIPKPFDWALEVDSFAEQVLPAWVQLGALAEIEGSSNTFQPPETPSVRSGAFPERR